LLKLRLIDLIIDDPIISNRHCLLFTENKGGDTIAVVEDLSSNGTFVNEAVIGRNKRRELKDQDEITVLDKARFVFRYPKNRETSAFLQQYTLLEKLGKGHFAEVFLCIEKSTGQRYAVKIFTKQPGVEERSKTEGLQQEIAVLMGVSHPNMLCLKDTFDEPNAVYLVLELAAEGELTEEETRRVFIQLFQGVKYLVSQPMTFSCCSLTVIIRSMSVALCIEILNPRIFCSQTRIFM
jgi:serine/threonine-protein kinase Chk2